MAAITVDVASNTKHHGLTQFFRCRVQIVLNRVAVQAESQVTLLECSVSDRTFLTGPQAGPFFYSVLSVATVVPPTPPHGRKLQIGEVSLRVPLDRPCEYAGLSIPGRLSTG